MRPEDQDSGPNRYTVVPRTLVFLTRHGPLGQEQVLLIKGAPTKRLWAGKYNGIGGHLESGETPLASARRELQEETGLQVADLELRGIVHITLPQPPGIVLFVFLGGTSGGEVSASDEGLPVWVDRERIRSLPLVEDLPELLPRLFKAQAANRTVYADYHVTDDGLQMQFS